MTGPPFPMRTKPMSVPATPKVGPEPFRPPFVRGTKVNQFDSGKATVYVIVGSTKYATKDWTASQAGGGAGTHDEGKVYGDTGVVIGLQTQQSFSTPAIATLRRRVVACVRQTSD